MKNLLFETVEILYKNNKTLDDIQWVGTSTHYIDLARFIELADTEYNSGFGATEVPQNLKIVGKDWWLERNEYDGSEWWEFKQMPIKPKEKLDIVALTVKQSNTFFGDNKIGYETLEELQEKEDE